MSHRKTPLSLRTEEDFISYRSLFIHSIVLPVLSTFPGRQQALKNSLWNEWKDELDFPVNMNFFLSCKMSYSLKFSHALRVLLVYLTTLIPYDQLLNCSLSTHTQRSLQGSTIILSPRKSTSPCTLQLSLL